MHQYRNIFSRPLLWIRLLKAIISRSASYDSPEITTHIHSSIVTFSRFTRILRIHTKQNISKMVQAVRINCHGDRTMLKKPHYEAIKISATDKIFTDHETSDIADRLGLPILTHRCPPNPVWERELDHRAFNGWSPFNNREATFLHLSLDKDAVLDFSTGSMGWGWAPTQWQNRVGSVIVVRQDKKPLSPLHVEALCKYCLDEVQPLIGHSLGEYAPEEPMSKETAMSMICRPTFVIFWNKLLTAKLREGVDVDISSPYAV
ncbi:hypothetical protein TWF696_008674 [Orbilia brochopaga]|uniref:Uncharacterized protein n=1 Tax=Orbilia brochopaga TaxID=3140254 RepID=A0AAV9UGP8_9PEZI